ncbi:hypothetical protein LPJ70_006048, partial [Coemansia sp. RSA 2708]
GQGGAQQGRGDLRPQRAVADAGGHGAALRRRRPQRARPGRRPQRQLGAVVAGAGARLVKVPVGQPVAAQQL